MSRSMLALILISVTLAAAAQIVLKGGMIGPTVQRSLSGEFSLRTFVSILFDPFVLSGLILYFLAALIWLLVLAKVEVSSAYPFVALGFVVTAVLGRILFEDTMSFEKLAGTILICVGVVLLSRG